MKKIVATLGSTLMLLCAWTSHAEGKGRPILDQFNTRTPDSYINVGDVAYDWQQGVTIGVSGQLVRIDVFVYVTCGQSGPTEVSVSLGSPWQFGSPAWSSTAVLVPGWNTFDLRRERISVEAGDELAIGIHGRDALCFTGIGIAYGDQYPGGDLHLNGALNSDVNDILFRTYVKQRSKKGG